MTRPNDAASTMLSTRRRTLRALVAVPLLGLADAAHAQVGRRYAFSVVLFRHTSAEADHILEDNGRPQRRPGDALRIGEGAIRPASQSSAMADVARRIESSGVGRVLAELSWEQVARTFQDAPWVRVEAGRPIGGGIDDQAAVFGAASQSFDTGPVFDRRALADARGGQGGLVTLQDSDERYELEGRLRVWTGRFLHLEVDLVAHSLDSTLERVRAITIRRSQRMESGAGLFYLDHPVIGAIARATRL